jgi:hypothetical protein
VATKAGNIELPAGRLAGIAPEIKSTAVGLSSIWGLSPRRELSSKYISAIELATGPLVKTN